MDQVACVWSRFGAQPTGKTAKFDAFGAEAQAEVGPASLGAADSAPYLACMATCELVRVLAAVFGVQEMKGHLVSQVERTRAGADDQRRPRRHRAAAPPRGHVRSRHDPHTQPTPTHPRA